MVEFAENTGLIGIGDQHRMDYMAEIVPHPAIHCRRRYWLVASWMWFSAAVVVVAQQPGAQQEEKPAPRQEGVTVREVGGRLMATGETVVVKGNPDEPARNSSIATKVETPLLETPRSISIVDRMRNIQCALSS
jgi:hypothetical protein